MAFLLVGVLLLLLRFLELEPVMSWPWWSLGIPFALAVVWWSVSDAMGMTQARAIRKMEARQAERREKTLRDMGLIPKNGSRKRH